MDINQQKLFDLLRWHHVGEQHAIKTQELVADIFGLEAAKDKSTNNPWSRKIREMIEELRHDHGACILSTPASGYFWASSRSEGQRIVELEKKRALTQLDNVNHLEHNLDRSFGGQLDMEI